ncbi:hypothetical protein [Caproicibacter sp.]|uniref:hypothetical protein n=1 Tax=Caproicibacter sp. TaxID=2814884 RepID=UPI003988D7A2
MKIALINASPKLKDSASGVILEELKGLLAEHAVTEYGFHTPALPENTEELANQDALVFAFPLYVDGIPSHLLNCMAGLEESFRKRENPPTVYAVANCGFYEGIQNRHALRIMRNWCEKSGLVWGRGVGLGGGGMLPGIAGVPPGKGPKKNFSAALRQLAESIHALSGGEDLFTSPNYPRIAYKTAAEIGWRQQAKANGLAKKDLFQKR